jgi:hypothetical protein
MARIEDRATGWWVFAGILLLVAGVLNIIWGIGAISDAKFFVAGQKYIFGSLHSWGWVTLILGIIELIAGLSLFSGGGFGRWIGIFAASLASISALLSIPAYPFWSLCVFALSLIILYELATAPERRMTT